MAYYVEYSDFTNYKGGAPPYKTVMLKARDLSEARKMVIDRFFAQWRAKKGPLYQKKVIPSISIGKMDGKKKRDSGMIYFLDYGPNSTAVWYPAYDERSPGYAYEIDFSTGRIYGRYKG